MTYNSTNTKYYNDDIFYKICSLIVVISPLFDAYYFFGTTLLSVMMVTIVAIYIFISSKNKRFELPKGYVYFLLYGLSIPVVNSMFSFHEVNIKSSYISILYYSICFGILAPYVKLEYFLKYYKIVVYTAFGVFLMQELCYFITGYRFSALLPFLTIRYSSTDMETFIEGQRNLGRSASLFLEPAHFVQYSMPLLAIQLGEAYKKGKILWFPAIISTIIIFFSKSGNAVVLLTLIWIFFFLKFKIHLILKIGILLPTIVVCSFYIFNFISGTEFGKDLLMRQRELEIGGTTWVSSGNMRISRGFLVYSDESTKDQLLGVGTGGTEIIIKQSKYYWMFGDETYMNLAQSLLVSFGLIGAILFFLHLILLLRRNTFEGSAMIVVFIGLAFIESFLFSTKMLLFITFAFINQKSLVNKNNQT